MARIFSWKLNDTENAYLYIPGKKNHISERIIDSNIINNMIDKVGKWNETKYKAAFDAMNEEIQLKYGEIIPYSESFFGETGPVNNVVVLSSSKQSQEEVLKELVENLKGELIILINQRFNDLRDEMETSYNALKKTNNKQTFDMLDSFGKKSEDVLKAVETLKEDMNNRLTDAEVTLSKASKILELDGYDINVDSIRAVVRETQKHSEWLKFNKNDMAEIKADYIEAKNKVARSGKNNKMFFSSLVNSMNTLDDTINKANNIAKESDKKLNEAIVLKEEIEKNKDIVMGASVGAHEFKTKSGNSLVIDDSGVHIDGDIFINGKKQK